VPSPDERTCRWLGLPDRLSCSHELTYRLRGRDVVLVCVKAGGCQRIFGRYRNAPAVSRLALVGHLTEAEPSVKL
jgi:hypothetical protein